MSEHAILPPSSSEQWGHCSGWYQATLGIPNPETMHTIEGTASHWVFAESYKTGLPCGDFIGAMAPNGFVIDEKAAEGAQVIVDDINEAMARYAPGEFEVLCEERVFMPKIHPEVWGSTDFGAYSRSRRALFVWDYKSGHRSHKAFEHFQTVLYANGIAERFGINGLEDQQTTVIIRIVQPFSYKHTGPIDEWVVRLSDLRGLFNILSNQAHANLGPNPRLTTGAWCRDCAAVMKCSAARMAGYNLIDVVQIPVVLDAMNGQELATEARLIENGLKMIQARLDALNAELEHRVKSGDVSSGLVLQNGGGGRPKWKVPPKQIAAIAQQFGADISVDAVLTPKQSVAKVPAPLRAQFEAMIKDMIETTPGKLRLVPIDESRTGRAFSRRENYANL